MYIFSEEPDDVSVTISPPEVIEGDDSVGLTCGPVRGTISWTKDGQSLGANNRYLHSGGSLQISHPQRMDAGIYHCTISNPFGNGSSSAQLTVYCKYMLKTTVRTLLHLGLLSHDELNPSRKWK